MQLYHFLCNFHGIFVESSLIHVELSLILYLQAPVKKVMGVLFFSQQNVFIHKLIFNMSEIVDTNQRTNAKISLNFALK